MGDLADLLEEHLALRREFEALRTRVANMIRPGKVTDRDHEKGVRIDLGGGKDGQPNKSDWIKSTDVSGVTSYLPREGEQGWLIAPNGDQQQGGFVPLTHSDDKKNPAPDGDTTVHFNRDGLVSKTKNGAHSIETEDTVTISAKTKIILKVGDVTYTLDSSGHVFAGDQIKHDDKNIGKTHVHPGIERGGAKTDPPDA